MGRALIRAVNTELLPFLKENQGAYVFDGIGSSIGLIFTKLRSSFSMVATLGYATSTASQIVGKVGKANQKRFNSAVASATGVDLGSIVATEGLDDFVKLSISKNVSLIKSLPEEYLKQVETIVNNGLINGERYNTIAGKITARVGSANAKLAGRIKTIAINEVQTINAQLTLKRSEALGIKKGIFMTSDDERVRECHEELDGVEYELKKGAWSKKCQKFIQPGITDINCRCSYNPIIEV